MNDIINIILSNRLFTLFTLCIIAVIIFFIIKKLIKLLIYAAIILVAFLSYVYYTGKSVDSVIKPVEKVIEKAKQVAK